MATNVFISFRFSDGNNYKKELDDLFDDTVAINNYSENEDRSNQTEKTIKEYLYGKLKETSVTICILTPNAINYDRNGNNQIDDWLYDELRYSLEDRENNRTNGVVALYTKEAESYLMGIFNCCRCSKNCPLTAIKNFENLVRKNMMNIKDSYKLHQCTNVYDELKDSYISLVSFDEFIKNYNYKKYIDNAVKKRENSNQFNLVKEM
ncbi:MAG: molecular chaperone Tir [Candidatus Shapirobacteria bacterium]|nr:molecular chaperone Tir [Candidatus Shapirobacteria bacterium]MDD4382537.1 molecular chaperone Tir [Candidatus Shapirobacteria bacterium]